VRSALEQFRDHPIDLLISDLSLPDGSGLDLIRELRAHRPIQAIALSGHGTDADLAKSKAAGFARHLTKPVELGQLLLAIQELSAELGSPEPGS
jgi:CheY-like chemotaxis protein